MSRLAADGIVTKSDKKEGRIIGRVLPGAVKLWLRTQVEQIDSLVIDLSGRDRQLLNRFLAQWDHPMSACFSKKGKQAASSLDQISKLRNIAAHGQSFLYRWQYELLHQLIAGKDGKGGLFRQIFAL